jgi:hypothetical protein
LLDNKSNQNNEEELMFRATVLGLLIFAGVAQAEEIRIGQGTTTNRSEINYFDTYPGTFCGVKAIRIERDHQPYGGLVFYSFQPNKPWIYSAKAHVGGNGWAKVPDIRGLGCLQRVRVYVPSAYPLPNDDDPTTTYFFTVYGLK